MRRRATVAALALGGFVIGSVIGVTSNRGGIVAVVGGVEAASPAGGTATSVTSPGSGGSPGTSSGPGGTVPAPASAEASALRPGPGVPDPSAAVWATLRVVTEPTSIEDSRDISNTWFKGGLLIDTEARVTGRNVRIGSDDPESGDAAFASRGYVRLSNVIVDNCSEGMRWASGDLEIDGLRIDCTVFPTGVDPHMDAFQVWPEGGGRLVLRNFLFDLSRIAGAPKDWRPNGSQIESAGRRDLHASFVNGTVLSGNAYYGLRIYQYRSPNTVHIENVRSDTPIVIQDGANVTIAGVNTAFQAAPAS